MKLILILLTLSVSLLKPSLASDFVNPLVRGFENDKVSFTIFTPLEYLLSTQKDKKLTEIIDAFKECNGTFPVPYDESIELFQNFPPCVRSRRLRHTNRPAKCLIDCMMRKTGVMTDEGFQVSEFVMLIKQLMYNFTTFDVSKKSPEKQREVFDAIKNLVDTNATAGAATSWPTIIEAYEAAANECKDKRARNNCETSWRTARCVVISGIKRRLNIPFYPVVTKTAA